MIDLLRVTESGLYCEAGGFHIDPWRAVDRAVITHAHTDHARPGSRTYLTTPTGAAALKHRVQAGAAIQVQPFGQSITLGDARVSLHPAGHILGSAQVRVEHRGEVWVVSGDYKLDQDTQGAAEPFEPVRCDIFVTESTFGLPIYRWQPSRRVFDDINAWWRGNREQGRTSVIFCYSLGKSQRVLAGVDASIGPIAVHGAAARFVDAYRDAGVLLPEVLRTGPETARLVKGNGLVIAPGSAEDSPWLRKFGPLSTAHASGWMQVRGMRRRGNTDRGFVLSDHADWPGLLAAIEATGAGRVLVTHGYSSVMVRWLREHGRDADVLPTRFVGEETEERSAAEGAEGAKQKEETEEVNGEEGQD